MNQDFVLHETNGVQYLRIPMLAAAGFPKHCFTTRIGGVSEGAYTSLNLSKTREASAQNKETNYRRVCKVLGVDYESLSLVHYEHGNGVHVLRREDAGKGFVREIDYPHCDGLLTNLRGITAVTLHADCVPLFFADQKTHSGGVCHAGWKGVSRGIATKMIQEMNRCFWSEPRDILVGIGPHIMHCCFEVQEDVQRDFEGKFGTDCCRKTDTGYQLDMQSVLIRQLLEAGVQRDHIYCANQCTFCEETLYFSHRRDQGNTGAMGAFFAL